MFRCISQHLHGEPTRSLLKDTCSTQPATTKKRYQKRTRCFPKDFTPYGPTYNLMHVEHTLSQPCTIHEQQKPLRATHSHMNYE